MAAKRILKFFLKLIVAAGIVVGAYFGISAIINSKSEANKIANTSSSLNIVSKVQNSGQSIAGKLDYNTNVKLTKINDINSVLVDYYNHYVSLTGFENYPDNSLKSNIISKMNELDTKIATTKNSLLLIDSSNSDTIKAQRVIMSANHYISQTQTFFELNDMLREYVYKVNYNVKISGIAYEAQLEMMKDYCKAMFDEYIVKTISKTNELPNLLIDESYQTNFSKVLKKYFNKQQFAVNGDIEVHLSWYYLNINKAKLSAFYVLNNFEKDSYKNSLDETEKKYFDNLYAYLNSANF